MKSKNKKIIAILVAAILFAVAGGMALYLYLMPQKTTVYVFRDNYEAGTVLSEDMLTSIQCDSKIVTAGSNADTSSRFVTGADIETVLNTGDSLRMDVASGMPLTLSMLSVNGGSSVEMNMDPSKIAVTVPVNSISGVTDDLKEGSRVNIYAAGIETTGTTLLFQNMRVLSVAHDSNGALTSATIEVTVDESLKLIYAANYSSVYLGLVDSAGYEFTEETEPTYAPTDTQ
uniref:Flp pilus assembly protein CpaB n=1 Tax=Lachnoclostridium phocaeense TaxID=1871021 RepID=UPI0026DCA963|nr:RcpC/CpaB family pilus assembly protein [Lachnoclostridium phocaeense]